MSYNHVTPTIPSTIAAGSAQPYSAPGGGGSTGNIRNNYAPSTGHVNQPSAVTLPVSQVPTPSNTPPVLPDPKLHYINGKLKIKWIFYFLVLSVFFCLFFFLC